jgi:hypothetical protein
MVPSNKPMRPFLSVSKTSWNSDGRLPDDPDQVRRTDQHHDPDHDDDLDHEHFQYLDDQYHDPLLEQLLRLFVR